MPAKPKTIDPSAILLLMLCSLLMLGACAKPKDVANARAILFEARKAEAEKCAPTRFREAETKLVRAEQSKDTVDAYVARRAAEAALAAAQAGCLSGDVEKLGHQRDRLTALQARVGDGADAKELEKLRRELAALKTISAEEEARLRDEIDNMRDDLSRARADTDLKDETIQGLKKKLSAKEKRLKAAEAERLKAEKALMEAMQKVVTIKKDKRGMVAYLSDILFDFDRATLRPGAKRKIKEISGLLSKYPYKKIEVEGHTDSTGPAAYNLELSKKRAKAVRKTMIANGIVAGKITSQGYGETRPLVSNDNPAGRQRNRRVEVVIK